MKKWTGSLALALLCTIIPAQAMDSQAVFSKVESNLDKGGTYFQITNAAPVWKQLPGIFKSEIASYAEAFSGRQSGEGAEILSMIDVLESKIVPTLKLDKITGWGLSQVPNGALADGSDIYLEKQFLLVDQTDGGMPLLNIAKGEELSITELNHFPESSLIVVTGTVNLKEVANLFLPVVQSLDDNSLNLTEKMAEPIAEMDNMSINQILEHLSGKFEYCVSMVPTQPGGKDTLAYTVSVPDPDSKLFMLFKSNIAKQVAKDPNMQKMYTVTDDAIVFQLPIPPGMLPFEIVPEISSANGRLQFSTTPAFRRSVEGGSSLANSPEFQALSKGLPQKGMAFSYVKPNASAIVAETMANMPGMDDFSEKIFDSTSDNPFSKMGVLSVSTITDDGVAVVANTTMDRGTFQLLGECAIGGYFLAKPFILQKLAENNDQAVGGKMNVVADGQMEACEGNLEMFANYLVQYAVANNNTYPADMNVLLEKYPAINDEFSEEGMPDDYAIEYFSGYAPADGNKPLIYILPESGSFLCVLFADGSVGSWPLRDMPISSAKGVVSFLQTQEEYSEAVLNDLVTKAEAIDAENAAEAEAEEVTPVEIETEVVEEEVAPATEEPAK